MRPLLVALAALALSIPAAGAARPPCWARVINDWYDNGRLDAHWSCGCIQEAIEHLPDSPPQFSDVAQVLGTAKGRACARATSPVERVASTPAKRSHVNWPARISASVLLFVAFGLLIWRRRQRATSRADRRARDRE